MKKPDNISEAIKNMPQAVGVYEYYDKNETLLYIGKAKNLKKRVSSYFTKNHKNKRLKILIKKITRIKYILVETEIDALLLENNLIKKHQPKYNVLLKDDKTYPWICISKEKVPKIFQTRNIAKKNGEYFGPYSSVRVVKILLNVFSNLFYAHGWTPVSYVNRTITSEENLIRYLKIIDDIRKILNGNLHSVISGLKKNMLLCSRNLEFEQAQIIKTKIDLLKTYQSNSVIVNPRINNIDVFTIVSKDSYAFINFMKIKSGAVIQTHTMELHKKLDETDEELLQLAIIELKQRFKSESKKIYCSHYLNPLWKGVNITVPKIGDKKKLIDLSLRNAEQLLLNKKKQVANHLSRQNKKRVLEQLKKDLRLKNQPKHIECFDNSNIQGTNSVSACVVFKDGKPSKKDYRHFNIKNTSGPNDFANMEEVIYRRYKRLLNEKKGLPDLIVIDGGKGQLSSTMKSLSKLNIQRKIAVISIAKRLEEIYFPNDSLPLYLDKRSESLKLIQHIRNEAHRFAINHHRRKRSNSSLKTSLDEVKGIGPKTIELLISRFGSIKKAKEAEKKELILLIGKNKTAKIIN